VLQLKTTLKQIPGIPAPFPSPENLRKLPLKEFPLPCSFFRNLRQTAVANGSGKAGKRESLGENAYAVAHEMQYKVVFLIHSLLSEAATFSALKCFPAGGGGG